MLFEWNALRKGDKVLAHACLDGSDLTLVPGVVVTIDAHRGTKGINRVGIDVGASSQAQVILWPARLAVHGDPRDPAMPPCSRSATTGSASAPTSHCSIHPRARSAATPSSPSHPRASHQTPPVSTPSPSTQTNKPPTAPHWKTKNPQTHPHSNPQKIPRPRPKSPPASQTPSSPTPSHPTDKPPPPRSIPPRYARMVPHPHVAV